jgi:hypothetical protein
MKFATLALLGLVNAQQMSLSDIATNEAADPGFKCFTYMKKDKCAADEKCGWCTMPVTLMQPKEGCVP